MPEPGAPVTPLTDPDSGSPQPDVWKARARKAVGPVFGLVVVLAIFVAILPQITSYEDVWEAAVNLGLSDWGVILLSVIANVATSGPPWMAAVPGLSYKRAMLMTQTTTLFTTVLPLGEAVGIATQVKMLSGWKFRGPGDHGRPGAGDALEPDAERDHPDRGGGGARARRTATATCWS